MEALLASPSMRQWSPDSSFDSDRTPSDDASQGSPRLPGWMHLAVDTPDSLAHSTDDENEQYADANGGTDRSNVDTAPRQRHPAWLTDELEEEWTVDDESDLPTTPYQPLQDHRPPSRRSQNNNNQPQTPTGPSKTPTATFNTCLTSLNKPRVPSSLRFAYTTADDDQSFASVNSESRHRGHDQGDNEESNDDNLERHQDSDNNEKAYGSLFDRDSDVRSAGTSDVNSVGTFIVKSNPSTTDAGQLQAAVRALQAGQSAGLGGVADGEQPDADKLSSTDGPDRLGGLLNLFNPSPPPAPGSSGLAQTAKVPSVEAFTFEAPLSTPRRSWKEMEHFSPDDHSATPTANPMTAGPVHGTPSVPRMAREHAVPQAPSLQGRNRYLHRPDTNGAVQSRLEALQEHIEGSQEPDGPVSEDDATPRASNVEAPPAQSPMPPLKLFEFQYDTFTREHLAALVDEIDGLGQAGSASHANLDRDVPANQETSFVDIMPAQIVDHGEDSRDSAEASRSIKRIRLSPPMGQALTPRPALRRTGRRLSSTRRRSGEKRRDDGFRTVLGASASARRVRTYIPSQAQPSQSFTTSRSPSVLSTVATTRERLDDANALLDRIRAKKAERDKARREAERDLDARQALSYEEGDRASVLNASRSRLDTSMVGQPDRDPFLAQIDSRPSSRTNDHVRPSPLPQLAEKASAMIRNHLLESAASSPSQLGHSRHSSEPMMGARGPQVGEGRRRMARRFEQRNQTVFEEEDQEATAKIDKTPHALTENARHRSLTTVGPGEMSHLLTALDISRAAVFDHARGQWTHPGSAQLSESGNRDPFRELDESRTSGETRIATARADANGLSGLGISAGTPKRVAGVANERSPLVVVSPPDATYFEPQPHDLVDEQADDTGTWGDGASARKREQRQMVSASTIFVPPESTPAPASVRSSASVRPLPQTPLASATNHTTRSHKPRSVLKTRSSGQRASATPGSRLESDSKEPRSVSFSDGRTTGKIVGLAVERGANLRPSALRQEASIATASGDHSLLSIGEPGSLELVDDDQEEDEEPDLDEASPSLKVSARSKSLRKGSGSVDISGGQCSPISSPLARPEQCQTSAENGLSVDGSSRKNGLLSLANQSATSRTFRRTTAPDATFLTECSFGVSAERLVKQITDVEPFEPHWDTLKSIDLSNKGADSVVRMKEFLPNLDQANFNNNQIAFLTGVPPTLRTLLIASNRLTSITSFGHLQNLERIDLSDNQLDTLHQLSCLRHLRELKADRNCITDLTGLCELDGLVRLSLAGNMISNVNFSSCKWSRLELLNLNRNKINSIDGIESLQALSLLNLDHNEVTTIEPKLVMPRMRVLRLCSNPVRMLDVSFVPKLRTLYIDSARLGTVYGTDTLRKLENLSIRDQSGEALTLAMRDVRDIRRLYLSGNPLPRAFPSEKFFNLVYLELAMCQITTLPADLANVIPNVRVLNLNFNFVEELEPLAGLTRLTSLSVVGARLSKVRSVAAVLASMQELQTCDLRMNPLTLAFYPPFISPPSVAMPSHAEHQILHPDDEPSPLIEPANWPSIDKKFRRTLPDRYYFKRASYRAVVLHSVPTLVQLDGLNLDRERPKLARLRLSAVPTMQSPLEPPVSGLAPTVLTVANVMLQQLTTLLGPATASTNRLMNDQQPASVSSNALMHPLGPCSDELTTEQHRAAFKDAVKQVRSALQSFNHVILAHQNSTASTTATTTTLQPSSGLSPANKVQCDKLASLWKEASASEAVLHNTRSKHPRTINQMLDDNRAGHGPLWTTLTARAHVARAAAASGKHPSQDEGASSALHTTEHQAVGSGRGSCTIELLETITTQLGLVTFKDSTTQSVVDGTGATTSREVYTLSIGGKVMVVDVEVLADSGKVVKVKMSYALETQHDCDETAHRLHEALRDVERVSDPHSSTDELQMAARGLASFQAALAQLRQFDEWTEETTVDCFAAYEGMVMSIDTEVTKQSTKNSKLPRLVPRFASPKLNVLLHASPTVQTSIDFDALKKQPDWFDTLAIPGLANFSIDLVKPQKKFSTASFCASFSSPVPISKSTGKKVLAALGHGKLSPQSMEKACPPSSQMVPLERLLTDAVSLDNGCVSSVPGVLCKLDFRPGNPNAVPGFLCTHIKFERIEQLVAVLAALRPQFLINDLFVSCFSKPGASEESEPRGKRQKRYTAAKKAQGNVSNLSLDELLNSSE
ncbi:Protein nud1 [Microbotryomycetes sp. JL201]|nr:Protein nud1 [Microbotryomycetes sp. JL201]